MHYSWNFLGWLIDINENITYVNYIWFEIRIQIQITKCGNENLYFE